METDLALSEKVKGSSETDETEMRYSINESGSGFG